MSLRRLVLLRYACENIFNDSKCGGSANIYPYLYLILWTVGRRPELRLFRLTKCYRCTSAQKRTYLESPWAYSEIDTNQPNIKQTTIDECLNMTTYLWE